MYPGSQSKTRENSPRRILVLRSVQILTTRPQNLSVHEAFYWLCICVYLHCQKFRSQHLLNHHKFAQRQKNGIMIETHEDIWRHYIKSTRFKVHFVSLLPISLILYLFNVRPSRIIFFCRLIRLLRLRYITELLENVFAVMLKVGININESGRHFLKMIGMVLLTAHFSACMFIFMSSMYGNNGNQSSWLTFNNIEGSIVSTTPSNVQYSVSLYWSLYTLTTVGYGDIYPQTSIETSWAILIMMLAALLCDAGVTAILSHLVDTLDRKSALLNQNVKRMGNYLKARSIPDKTFNRLKKYYANTQLNQHGVNETQIFKLLPISLKHEILVTTMWESFTETNGLFNENAVHSSHTKYDHGTLLTIIKNMKPKTFFTGQTIVKKKDIWQGLYFIIAGHVKIKQTVTNFHDEEKKDESNSIHIYENTLIGKPGEHANIACFIEILTDTYYISTIDFKQILREILICKLK